MAHGMQDMAMAGNDNATLAELETLRKWFNSIDRDHSGSLSVLELQAALREGGFNFPLSVVSHIIRQCDKDGSGTITLDEFGRLHNFLATVQSSFYQLDQDGSGRISLDEMDKALKGFGYKIELPALRTIFQRHDPLQVGSLGLSEFLALTLYLRSATATFKAFDPRGSGTIHLSFSQFLYASANTL